MTFEEFIKNVKDGDELDTGILTPAISVVIDDMAESVRQRYTNKISDDELADKIAITIMAIGMAAQMYGIPRYTITGKILEIKGIE